MEAYILLLLFILLLPVAIYLVLSDPNKGTPEQHKREQVARQKSDTSSQAAAYAVLGVLLAGICALTVMVQRRHA